MRVCVECNKEQTEVWVIDGKFYCNDCKYVPEMYRKGHTFDQLYHFVDVNTTGKPIEFHSKSQWKKHLKKHGLTDDFVQGHRDPKEFRQPKRDVEQRRKMFADDIRQELKDRGLYDSRKLFIRR